MMMDGPLAPWAAGMAERLETLGYAPTTTAGQLQLAARFSRFLQARGLAVGAFGAEVAEEFFADLHAHHGSSWPTPRAFVWLVEYLNELGIAMSAPPGVQSAEDEVVGRFGATCSKSADSTARR